MAGFDCLESDRVRRDPVRHGNGSIRGGPGPAR
jgi:hypothetical protein